MFEIQRDDERIPFTTHGLLDIRGSKYSCMVDNISNTGVLIEVNNSEQEHIRLGDIGTLHILLLAPVRYSCRVVRIDSNEIGLHFLEQ